MALPHLICLNYCTHMYCFALSGQQARGFYLFQKHDANSEVMKLFPVHIRQAPSLADFKSRLKTHFQSWPWTHCEMFTVILFDFMFSFIIISSVLVYNCSFYCPVCLLCLGLGQPCQPSLQIKRYGSSLIIQYFTSLTGVID